MTPSIYKEHIALATIQAESEAMLDLFGNELARRQNYKTVKGMDAIHFFLIHRFNWLPRDVKSLSRAEILLILSEEMSDWTLPVEFR